MKRGRNLWKSASGAGGSARIGLNDRPIRWNVTLGVSRVLAYLIIGLLLGVVLFFVRRLQALQ